MSPTIVVPDTGIILAQAFGPLVDPQAARAESALAASVAAQARIVVPPSIASEIAHKLGELDSIYTALQAASVEAVRQDPDASGLSAAEAVLLSIKQQEPAKSSRYFAAIEVDTAERILAAPTAPLTGVFASVAANAFMVKEGMRVRCRPSYVEFLDYPEIGQPVAPLAGVTRHDLVHLESCQKIAERVHTPVVFVILERNLESRKREIELAFNMVRVTTPVYIKNYLESPA